MPEDVEEWRPVVGFEDAYEVSNLGRVRRSGRAARTGNGRGGGARIGRLIAQGDAPGGYVRVQLWKAGRGRAVLVHRIVAAAFIGPVPDGEEVNHRDGDKKNNAVSNLEYLTRSDNNRHAYRMGLRTANVEHLAYARRKPRVMVPCECGCGGSLESPDRKGRDRHFIHGHNLRKSS